MGKALKSIAFALTVLLTAFPVVADGKGFVRFVLNNQAFDLPPDAVSSARVIKDFNNQDALEVTVTPDWLAPLSSFTKDPHGRIISIFVCGALVAEPQLQGRISGGRFFLTGDPAVIHKAAVFLAAKSCSAVPNS
ncbi:MAG: hypothetical protein JWS10_821 [Cypionkella sp.]|nr:hypothetical protein [Cypionkella sp.]